MRGELRKASDLFEKYRRQLVAPESSVITAFIEIVDELYGLPCRRSDLRYDPATRTLSFRGQGMLQSEVKLHESEIMAQLSGRLGSRSVPKVIL